MWIIAEYKPITLFSFRSGTATSSGAKSLFSPTPFAIRTALLDAAIRTKGVAIGRVAFDWIKRLSLAIRPPERLVVTNLFTKILKPAKKEDSEKTMQRTIAFREYVQFDGIMGIAVGVPDNHADELEFLLMQINYFGKRGSFLQLMPKIERATELPQDFITLDGAYIEDKKVRGEWPISFKPGLLQLMDDWGDELTFSKVNIYTDDKISLGKDRVRKGILLPYRLVRSSKSFSYYERI